MATISETDIQKAELSADDRLLIDAGWMDMNGVVTNDGWLQVRKFFFEEKKAELVKLVKKVRAAQEKVTEEE